MRVYADPGDFEQNVMQLATDPPNGIAGQLILSSAPRHLDDHEAAGLGLPAGDYCAVCVGESMVLLPMYAGRPETPNVPQLQRVGCGSVKVLAVDDDETVLQVVCDSLSLGGFEVMQSRSGEEALEILHAQGPAGVDLLISDVAMPGMSGRMLADRAAELLPRLKVLYISGYADEAIRGYGVSRAAAALLRKPFTPGELLRKVRELLDPALQQAAKTGRTAE
jgi:CheY-like chemotaxis protein